jgi:RNA polymerase sigma factor (sigma-70 family)
MNDSDLQLLENYAQRNSQDSFAALVNRHLNLVFSAALRHVHSPQLAEEISQSVFADLARSANKLKPDTILAAWLYEVTRRTAIDVVRRESRRQLREKVAHELTAMNATADDWTEIEPFLDEAMHALDETDRTAVLLRYFENKSLREVGETLGTTDDAAQKRVSRAVERLREFFAKRGVTIGASGLVVLISANAVQAAPIGLAVTISTAAALAGIGIAVTTTTLTKTIAMTTIQKTLVAATLVAAVGTGIYEARQTSTLQTRIQVLQQQQENQSRQTQEERDEAINQLAFLKQENARLQENTRLSEIAFSEKPHPVKTSSAENADDSIEKAATEWLSRVSELKQRLELNPQAKIPELKFLTKNDWLSVARGELKTEDNLRQAFGQLRTAGKTRFGGILESALRKYLGQSETSAPDSAVRPDNADFRERYPGARVGKSTAILDDLTNLSQLNAYFDMPISNDLLDRWEILPVSSEQSKRMYGNWLITEKEPLDQQFDSRYVVYIHPHSGRPVGMSRSYLFPLDR